MNTTVKNELNLKVRREIIQRLNSEISTEEIADIYNTSTTAIKAVIRRGDYGVLKEKLYRFNKNFKNKVSLEEALHKFKVQKGTCYLTGKRIDLENTEYSLDHIIPISRGGSNSYENLGFLQEHINVAKRNMTPVEFINMCVEVALYAKKTAAIKNTTHFKMQNMYLPTEALVNNPKFIKKRKYYVKRQ